MIHRKSPLRIALEKRNFDLFKKILSMKNTTIQEREFDKCNDIFDITIPQANKIIFPYSFFFCRHLRIVNIPSSVTEIKKYAFAYCLELYSISFPDCLLNIEEKAFYQSRYIRIVKIHNSMNEKGKLAIDNYFKSSTYVSCKLEFY